MSSLAITTPLLFHGRLNHSPRAGRTRRRTRCRRRSPDHCIERSFGLPVFSAFQCFRLSSVQRGGPGGPCGCMYIVRRRLAAALLRAPRALRAGVRPVGLSGACRPSLLARDSTGPWAARPRLRSSLPRRGGAARRVGNRVRQSPNIAYRKPASLRRQAGTTG